MSAELDAVAARICSKHDFALGPPSGAGAFKNTYRIARGDGQTRALKIYRSVSNIERVRREIDAISRCNHPNIVRLDFVDTLTDEPRALYSVEEYPDGGSLSERVRNRGALQREDVVRIGRDLAGAVAHLAGHRLVHRDIKPDNVMFRASSDAPVLVDLGLVRDLAKESVTETWLMRGPGTPFFAAPEQLRNEKPLIDWRTDQFSLATTLAVAATGRHPFANDGDSQFETVERVATRSPLSPTFRAWAGQQQLGMLVRMLSVWPVGRYATPAEFANAFGTPTT